MNSMELPSLAVICGSCTAGAAYVPVRHIRGYIGFKPCTGRHVYLWSPGGGVVVVVAVVVAIVRTF
jgi:hypothetical protein